MTDLYHVIVDGERLEWGGVDYLPRHDAVHVVAGALKDSAEEVILRERSDGG